MHLHRLLVVSLLSCITSTALAEGGGNAALPEDLTTLSIEELMEIEVTSVSRKEERLSRSASAVYVITQEDIRRSGLKRIPQLLRGVPGLEVARIDANKWAITSRGFNGRFANKLLVLIDGRTVYNHLFSGVFWDVQDTLLEDVERIEVIRGPGAAVWGSNAVNGVINIITKKARDSQGALISAGGGDEELAFGGVRYGGRPREDLHYRTYLKWYVHDDSVVQGAGDGGDEWAVLQGGFRLDWQPSAHDLVTFQGDVYGGEAGSISTLTTLSAPFSETIQDDASLWGGNLLARWTRDFADGSQTALQLYYDRTSRDDAILDLAHDTVDVDFQHRLRPLGRHELLWGTSARYIADHFHDGPSISLDHSGGYYLLSAFLQDEVTLVEDRLRLTLGAKLEVNPYSGVEVQPDGRLLWTPHPRHTAWGAVSRAVRTPSLVEDRSRTLLAAAPGIATRAEGDDGVESEELLAFQLGYRVLPVDRLSLDLAAFYNIYDDLVTLRPGAPTVEGSPPLAVLPLFFHNGMDGDTYGVELAANLQVSSWWRLSGGWSYLRMDLDASSAEVIEPEAPEGRSPRHQVHLRSQFNLPGDLELDLLLWWVDRLTDFDVPSYFRLDARLGWRPLPRLEVGIGVQNLLDDRHPEFGSEVFTNPTEVERAFYGMVTWRF